MPATGAILVRFVGPTLSHEIPEFLAAIDQVMPEKNAVLLFDLRELVGHNPDTKEPIRNWLIRNRSRISSLTVQVPKAAAIIKMVVAAIGLAVGIRIRVEDE
jgi:hypothetical protein